MTTKASTMNYDMFDKQDYINMILQRSRILSDVKNSARFIRKWSTQNDEAAFDDIIAEKGEGLAERTFSIISKEFDTLLPTLDQIKPKRIADIGCGYAFFDFLAHQKYGSEVLLIDIEDNDLRHFGYNAKAAAYTSLNKAKEFLKANGCPEEKISIINPEKEDLYKTKPVDLAVSFRSCGFHYPINTYLEYFTENVVPGGSIILDIRGKAFRASEKTLAELGEVSIIDKVSHPDNTVKSLRIWLKKHD